MGKYDKIISKESDKQMAITTTPIKVRVTAKLNNGLDSEGNISTVSLAMASLSLTGYDDAKMMQILSALEPCLSLPVYSIERTNISTIEGE